MNPALLDGNYDRATGEMWRKTRLPDRLQAITTHEFEEHIGGSHEEALRRGPNTPLPISHAAREMLRQMERGWDWGR